MNLSAAYSGGCSASVKTSVTTVQQARKKTCLPSSVRDVSDCRPGWNKLLISALLPAVNRMMGSGSLLSSTRKETEVHIPSSRFSSLVPAATPPRSRDKILLFHQRQRWDRPDFPADVGVEDKASSSPQRCFYQLWAI